MKNKYKIAEIAIEIRDGKPFFWVYNAGYHAGQGGMEFVWGNVGVEDLQSAISILESRLSRDMDAIVDNVQRKELENEKKRDD